MVVEFDPPFEPGIDNDNVPKLTRMRADNTLEVFFFVAADPHFQSDFKNVIDLCWGFSDNRLPQLRSVATDINGSCKSLSDYFGDNQDCIGGMMAGDMTRLSSGSSHWDDSVYAFRALYEYDGKRSHGKPD